MIDCTARAVSRDSWRAKAGEELKNEKTFEGNPGGANGCKFSGRLWEGMFAGLFHMCSVRHKYMKN